jgi:hypothetical protein
VSCNRWYPSQAFNSPPLVFCLRAATPLNYICAPNADATAGVLTLYNGSTVVTGSPLVVQCNNGVAIACRDAMLPRRFASLAMLPMLIRWPAASLESCPFAPLPTVTACTAQAGFSCDPVRQRPNPNVTCIFSGSPINSNNCTTAGCCYNLTQCRYLCLATARCLSRPLWSSDAGYLVAVQCVHVRRVKEPDAEQ